VILLAHLLLVAPHLELAGELQHCLEGMQRFDGQFGLSRMHQLYADVHEICVEILAVPHFLGQYLLDDGIDLLPVVFDMALHEGEQCSK
jgi:hypothetical protein